MPGCDVSVGQGGGASIEVMTKLAETYLHLDVWVPASAKFELYSYACDLAAEASKNFHDQNIQISLEYKDGSIRIWIKYLGYLYVAIVAYGEFREGIDYLVSDAQRASEFVFEGLQKEGMKSEYVRRKERRLGVPGRLKRAVRMIDNEYYYVSEEYLEDIMDQCTFGVDNHEDKKLIEKEIRKIFRESRGDRRDRKKLRLPYGIREEYFADNYKHKVEYLQEKDRIKQASIFSDEQYVPRSKRVIFSQSDQLLLSD